MARLHASLVLVLIAVALVATRLAAAPPAGPCFTSGSVTYQMASAASPDYRVRIGGQSRPDMRIALVDDSGAADFVLIDEPDDRGACQAAGALKTVSITGDDTLPAVNVAFSRDDTAEYRLFVRSARFSQHDAAALFAAMWDAKRKQDIAAIR